MQLIMNVLGMLTLILIAIMFSSNYRAIKLRVVISAFMIQISIGAFIFYIPNGSRILAMVSNTVLSIISYGKVGLDFIFGGLVSDKMFELFGNNGFIFALRVLPVIIFFSSLISVLYYLGIMQLCIRILGRFLQWILGTSSCESLSAIANIFVGQTEAPLIIRTYIPTMTKSELFAIMCGGLASISGSALAGYVQMGVSMEYLIAASFMAAPGGLLFAKLIVPETEENQNTMLTVISGEEKAVNIIDAAAIGAVSGMHLAFNIGAMLLAFIALIALFNGILDVVGNLVHISGLSLEFILGWIFAPIAYLIGIPWYESIIAGSFIGQKLVVNEFVAYMNFSEYLKPDLEVIVAGKQVLSKYTKVVISFALCGFANLSSIAILVGGLGGIAPNRRKDIARLGLKAVLAGSLSNLMSATIVGFFLSLTTI